MEQTTAEVSEGQVDRLHAQLVSLANRFGMLEGSVARLRTRLDTVLAALDDGRTPTFTHDGDAAGAAAPPDLDEVRTAIDGLGTRIETLASNVEASGQDPLAQRAAVAAANASRTAEATNEALASLRQAVEDLGAAPRDVDSGAPAVDAQLLTSTAAAVTALEARLDRDFETLGHQLEAVASLLSDTVAAIGRLEENTGEVHPVSERMKQAANSLLGALRTRTKSTKSDSRNTPSR
jgi:methyl-accepting chemotaxis protein